MSSALFTHPACLRHAPPIGHPEKPDRLAVVLAGLESERFADLVRLSAPPASLESIARAHSSRLMKILDDLDRSARQSGYARIDSDTFMSADSLEAALHAAGAVVAAVDGIMAADFKNAFCAIRPPGHHAERNRSMGFCLLNSVAIGALHARAVHGISRIAIVDFDVHHGNGTQDIFFDDPDALYVSTHQMPLYPGTGYPNERGAAQNILNYPLAPGSGSVEFQAIYRDSLLPALEDFAPRFIFVSAGFDAHRADPLANLNLDEDDFAWATHEICAVARRTADGRVVSALEGGYDLGALQRSAAAHVLALMEA